MSLLTPSNGNALSHSQLGSQRDRRRRLAINARFTPSDTTIYAFRISADPIDGSDLDVSWHTCVLVHSESRNSANCVIAHDDLLASLA
jgi:hypothetical protein